MASEDIQLPADTVVQPTAPVAAIIPDFVLASAPYVMWGTLLVYNLAIFLMLRFVFDSINLRDALREKNLDTSVQKPPPNPVGNPVQGDGAAGAPAVPATSDEPADTSFSRVSGIVGTLILACFIWALGNLIIFKSFGPVNEISDLLEKLGSFFLAASALFAPYAFNQLGEAFKPRPKSGQ